MKRILLLSTMIFLLFVWKGNAQMTENFESGIPSDWTTFKLLGAMPTPYVDDPSALTVSTAPNVPGWGTTTTGSLVCEGTQSAYVDRGNIQAGNTSQSWLVSPLVTIPQNGRLYFTGKQTLGADLGTVYKVRVSTSSQTDVSTFNDVIVSLTEPQLNPGPPENFNVCYTHGEDPFIDLSAFANQDVYVAFIKIDRQSGAAITADRWVLDEIRIIEQCMPPTDVTVVPQADSATISWTGTASNYEVSIIPGTGTPEVGTVFTTTTNSVEVSPLDPSTSYMYFVRSVCPDNESEWVGPFTFSTTQIPVVLGPGGYLETFETPSYGWTFINGSQTNKWAVGTATNNGGANSMYISNNNGGANTYTNNSASTVHAYRDIQLPASVGQVYLSYDWKAQAEACCDYIRVWVVPSTFTPTAGTLITVANSGGAQFGGNHNGQANWQSEGHLIDVPPTWAGQIVRLVFEWRNDTSVGTNPPAAVDNVNIELVTCSAPTGLAIADLTENDVTFTWGAPGGTAPSSYDYYFGTTSAAPNSSTDPTGNVTDTTVTIDDLEASTSYYFWVRSNCGVDGESFWVGPVSFNTAQVPTPLDYFEDFESANPGWTLSNGSSVNAWAVGSATSNSPTNSLYISNNSGTSNAYTGTVTTVVHAYKDLIIPATADQVFLSYDWKGIGEGTAFDYMRVWLVPVSFTPTVGTQIAAASGGQQLGANHNQQANWVTANHIIDVAGTWAGQIVRLVFEWRNDGSVANQPPAAVDNINVSVITCPSPSALTLNSLGIDTADISWTGSVGLYDYYLSTSITSPTPTTDPTGTVSANNISLTDLADSTTYYFWVRSNCEEDGVSFWVGPLIFNTPQVPASLPFFDDFEDPSGFTLSNGTQANKWVIGGATFNSPSQSLYVSNDNGLTNAYINTTSVVHSYRDIQMPDSVGEISVSYDWKCAGEGSFDYMRVWLVPVTFTPTTGTLILAANSITQFTTTTNATVPGNHNLNPDWMTTTQIFNIPAAYQGQIVRLVFEWRNDTSTINLPAAAVDNVNVAVITCSSPTNLAISESTSYTVTYTWNVPGGTTPESYDYYFSTSSVSPAPDAEPTGNTAETSVTMEDLELATTYYFWVRSNCGDEDGVSFWVGPIPFATPICELENQCLYTFNLTDTFGDGWNGNTMTVAQNGIPVQVLTLPSGGSAVVQVPLCHGVPFTLFWNAGGSFAGEVGVSITNFLGEVIYTKSPGTGAQNSLLYEGIAECTPPTCPQPTDLLVTTTPNSQIVTLSWTPGGTETQWEIIIQPSGSAAPLPTSTGIVVNDNPNYTFNADNEVLYEYYVRAVCAEDDSSHWSGPMQFSIFVPPGCAQVDVVGVGVEIVDNNIVVCPGDEQETEVTLTADFFGIAATTSYEIESIDYAPPFPFSGGGYLSVEGDDVWSPVVSLPFNFCFFGESFSQAKVGGNGVVMFGNGMADGGNCPWAFNQTIPNVGFPIKNAIYGVYQDTNPATSPNADINYQVLGTYPCRALVVNYNNLYQFSCNASTGLQVSQIVIYEISNIIEVYVERRVPCTSWQSGAGVIGIQNAAGTEAYVPPGRNTGPWTAEFEGWRFTPNGASDVELAWTVAGDFISDEETITVSLTPEQIAQLQADGTYTITVKAEATYETCSEDDPPVTTSQEIDVTFIYSFPETDPEDLTECTGIFDLTENTTTILEDVTNPSVFEIHYFNSQEDAESGDLSLAIENPEEYNGSNEEEIWVRIMDITNNCSIVKSFTLYYGSGDDVLADFAYDSDTYCINGNDPVLVPAEGFTTGGQFSYTSDPTGLVLGLNTSTGEINLENSVPGVYEITYTVIGCPDEDTHTFEITILEQGTATTQFSYDATEYCNNDPIETINPITDPDFTTGGEFSYTPTDLTLGLDPSTGEININSSDPGTYDITYTVSNVQCSGNISHTVTISILPSGILETGFVYDSSTYCIAGADPVIVLATDFVGGGEFTSVPALGGLDAVTGAIDLGDSTAGVYEITYTIEPSGCSDGGSTSVTIEIINLMAPQLEFSYTETCANSTVNPIPAGNVTSGGTFSSATLSVNPETGEIDMVGSSPITPGIHEITYTLGVNTNTCTDGGSYTATINFTDSITPVTGFNFGMGMFCYYDGVVQPSKDTDFFEGGMFSAEPAGLSIDPTTGDINVTGSDPGTYVITYTVSEDAATCNTGGSTTATITIFGEFMVAVTDECIGSSYWLNANPVDGSFDPQTATYVWTVDGIEAGYGASLNVSEYLNGANIPASGLVVSVAVNDGCQSFAQFTVLSTACMIQKGISPNGDTANNAFDLTGMGVKKLTIFNRYGMEVYSKSDYVNEWTGLDKKGNELPDGTYFYVIHKNTGENISGWVYINRKY